MDCTLVLRQIVSNEVLSIAGTPKTILWLLSCLPVEWKISRANHGQSFPRTSESDDYDELTRAIKTRMLLAED